MNYPLNYQTKLNQNLINFHQINKIIEIKDAFEFAETDEKEMISFLAKRPVQTVIMNSFIKDNGVVSDMNRGKFYGYRNDSGNLEGVALIGHTTIIEAHSDEALRAFAKVAQTSEIPLHVVFAADKTELFWQYLKPDFSQPRVTCKELLFELNFPFLIKKCKWDVRIAKPEELLPIAEAHAQVAYLESGINPLEKDREGYLKRSLRRIEKQRTFVVFENEKLVFKADVVAETTDVIYLEGVYVAPDYRGQGVGSACLSKLSSILLDRVQHICLLSNVDFKGAHRSFMKAGFRNSGSFTTLFA